MLRSSIILVATCVFGLLPGLCRDALELESRYEGDGWFEYRLRTLEDPFLSGITFGQLLPVSSFFTNYLNVILPPHWTNYFYNGQWTGIMYDASVVQPRINEISFSVQSSSTYFKRQAHGFDTSVYFQFSNPYYYGGGLGGYVNLDCLVPCSADETDGSPAVIVFRMELIPDITIDELIVTNGLVYGLIFSWAEPSTVQLEGSHDLTNWTSIARFFGDPPQSTWTTNAPINSYGTYFRLSLIGIDHITNAIASASAAISPQKFREIPITSQELIQNQIKIGFASIPDAAYEVDQYEWPRQIVATNQIIASKTCTTVNFDIGEPHRSRFFKVRQLAK